MAKKINIEELKKSYLKRVMKFGFNETFVFRTIRDMQFKSNLDRGL